MLRKWIAAVVAWSLLLTAALPVLAEQTPESGDLPMSDEDFFGRYDAQAGEWLTEGKLDYEYSDALRLAEKRVKSGDYESAKKIVLEYYAGSDIPLPDLGTKRDTATASLSAENIFSYNDVFVGSYTARPDEPESVIDVTDAIANGMDVFMLTPRKKEAGTVMLHSRETGFAPTLEIEQDGSVIELKAVGDTYIRAGAYQDENYGDKERLLLCDDFNQKDPTMAYGDDTTQVYLRFCLDGVKGSHVASAALRLSGECEEERDILVYTPKTNVSWDENQMTWSNTAICTLSWNGVEGGTNWQKPWGTTTEFANVQTRQYFLKPMILEFHQTQDKYYIENAIGLLTDFIEDQGAGLPRTLEAGVRGTTVSEAYRHLVSTPYLNEQDHIKILKYLWQEAEFLNDPVNFHSNNNWGVHETKGLYNIAVYFPEFKRSGAWLDEVFSRVNILMDQVIKDDYSYVEHSNGYGSGVLDEFNNFKELERISGRPLPAAFNTGFQKLSHFMMDVSTPSGIIQNWGDGNSPNVKNLLTRIGERINDDELTYFGTSGKDGVEPDYTSTSYPAGKLGVMRSGWDETSTFLFLAARNGGGHSHPDALTIALSAYGRPLLKDTGTSSYDANDPIAIWQRNRTVSHNTIEINDTAQRCTGNDSENGDSGLEMVNNPGFDLLSGYTMANVDEDGLEFSHKRSVAYIKPLNFFIVSDSIDPPDDSKENKYNQAWHMDPEARISIDPVSKAAKSNFDEGANLLMVPAGAGEIDAALEAGYGYVGDDISTYTGTSYVSYVKQKQGGVNFDTILYPFHQNEEAEIKVSKIETDAAGHTVTALALDENAKIGNSVYYLSHEQTPGFHEFGGYRYNGKMLFLQKSADQGYQYLQLANGRQLSFQGTIIIDSKLPIADISISRYGSKLEIDTSLSMDELKQVRLFAPNQVASVKVNGESVYFKMDDHYIEFTSEPAEPGPADHPTGAGGGGSGGGGGTVVSPVSPVPAAPPPAKQEPTEAAKTAAFEDISNHWAEQEINDLAARGMVNGVGNAVFRPDAPVTRAEFVSMISKCLRLDTPKAPAAYEDVGAEAWYFESVSAATEYGIVQGDGGVFRPDDWITREETAKIMANAYQIYIGKTLPDAAFIAYDDAGQISEWALPDVASVTQLGLMNGREGGFAPKGETSRAEAAVILYRLIHLK